MATLFVSEQLRERSAQRLFQFAYTRPVQDDDAENLPADYVYDVLYGSHNALDQRLRSDGASFILNFNDLFSNRFGLEPGAEYVKPPGSSDSLGPYATLLARVNRGRVPRKSESLQENEIASAAEKIAKAFSEQREPALPTITLNALLETSPLVSDRLVASIEHNLKYANAKTRNEIATAVRNLTAHEPLRSLPMLDAFVQQVANLELIRGIGPELTM